MTILYVVYVITIWLLHINFITKYVILSIGNNGFWVINLAFYKRIKDLREDHDMTQQQVADYLSMKQPQYFRYEKGTRDIPSDVLIALARLYGVSTDYILGLTDE